MFSYRLRGLVNLHIVAVALAATSYFIFLALIDSYLPVIKISKDVNLLLYSAPILLGMFLSGRSWQALAPKFHAITWPDSAWISTRQVLVVALMIFGLMVATKDRLPSRLFLALYLVSCWGLLLFFNRFFPRYLAKLTFHQGYRVPVLLVGTPTRVDRIASWIEQKKHLGIHVIGLASDDPQSDQSIASVPWLGPIKAIPEIIAKNGVGQVILVDLPTELSETRSFVETCQRTGCRLLIYQNIWDRLPVPMVPLVEDQHFFLTVHAEPLEDPLNRGVKRCFDILLSLPVVMLILPPLCLVVIVMQSIQAPGPLLFKRKRGGHRNREFEMLKFRSMYVAPPNSALEAQQAKAGDSRIFPFGRFLRKTSLDEFPQFWNVLIGDMSIVGPRPHLTQHDREFSEVAKAYRTRQLVKPGVTGLAQISGFRGEILDSLMLDARVQMDVTYITTWSIWLDIQIVIKTLLQVFFPPKTAV